MTEISIIIPRYNQGAFIKEAVDNVLAQTFYQDFESPSSTTDLSETNKFLSSFSASKKAVLSLAENQGPSEARNTLIKAALRKYIFRWRQMTGLHSLFSELLVRLERKKSKIHFYRPVLLFSVRIYDAVCV